MKTFRQLSEIIMPQVVSKSVAKQRLATEAKEKTEYDYEGDMARGQLQSIISNAQRVHDMLEDDTNIAEWVQSKITLAEDYISTVANYMMSEVDESVDLDEGMSGGSYASFHKETGKIGYIGNKTGMIKHVKSNSDHARGYTGPDKKVGDIFGGYPKKTVKEEQIDELSSDLLGRYKKSAGADASKADKAGDYDKGNKRFSGIMKATKKQLDNDMKKEEFVQEGRPSQRHPLEGHDYHKKTDAELVHIAKDAHAAAEAMKSHNTTAENKYRDQANDSATVRHFRKTSGTPDWYKKKYGHMKEEMDCNQSKAGVKCTVHGMKDCTPGQMKETFRPMDEPNYNNSIQARQKKADDANKPPFDGPYKKSTGVVTDKSGAKHGGMSIARNLAKQAMKKQSSKMSVKENLGESRKAEIVKEIMKKGKKKENNTFQAEPEITTTVVKADN